MLKGLNLGALFALVFGAASTAMADKAIVDAGGVASSPAVQVGSDNGKPLFARIQFSTDNTFGAATTGLSIASAIAQAASEGAAIHAETVTASAPAEVAPADPHA